MYFLLTFVKSLRCSPPLLVVDPRKFARDGICTNPTYNTAFHYLHHCHDHHHRHHHRHHHWPIKKHCLHHHQHVLAKGEQHKGISNQRQTTGRIAMWCNTACCNVGCILTQHIVRHDICHKQRLCKIISSRVRFSLRMCFGTNMCVLFWFLVIFSHENQWQSVKWASMYKIFILGSHFRLR